MPTFSRFVVKFDYSNNETPDSAYISIGLSNDPIKGGDKFILDDLSFSVTTDIKEETGANNFSIGDLYPMPAKNYIDIPIVAYKPENLQIKLYDLTGKELLSIKKDVTSAGNGIIEIPLQKLIVGMYFMTIENNNGVKYPER